MFNFCLYRWLAQKVCAFPVKTLCVLYKNPVRFTLKPCAFLPERLCVFFALNFSALSCRFYFKTI
jgi:hypothetical protein